MTVLQWEQVWPLGIAAGVLPVLLAFRGRRGESGAGAWWGMAALRAIALLCLVAAMCEPVLRLPATDVAVAHALDVSRSVPVEQVMASVRAIRSADGTWRTPHTAYVLFAEHARPVASTADLAAALVSSDRDGENLVGRGGTDLARALETAVGALPGAACRHVVLASDGTHTQGDLWAAVERARAGRVRIHSLPLPASAMLDAAVFGADLPERPPAGRPIQVEVRVRSTAPVHARLGVSAADRTTAWTPVDLPAGDSLWRLPVTFRRAGVQPLAVRVSVAGDQRSGNDVWRTAVAVGSRQRVLQLAHAPGTVRGFGETLSSQGFDVTTMMTERIHAAPASLDRFDVVVLHDPERERVPAWLERSLERYVREGGGLVFVAGEHSHGREGWSGSRLERVLPVRFEGPPRREEAEVLFVIDRSYSMRGPRLEIARSAVASAIEALGDRHRAGVLVFDARAREIVALAPKAQAKAQLEGVGPLIAAGQTNVFVALWDAYLRLRNSRAETRHIVLLSDGNTAPVGRRAPRPGDVIEDDAPPDSFEALGAMLSSAGISVTTVAIGDDPDTDFMGMLAKWTGGRARLAAHPGEVPALFADEVRRLSGDALVEKRFAPRVIYRADPVMGIDFARSPPLLGLAVARVRTHADRILDGADDHPLLVTHRYGLGVATAFLSDASGRWSAEWRKSSAFGPFWAQTVRAAARTREDGAVRFAVAREGPDLLVSLEARDGPLRAMRAMAPVAVIAAPDGETSRLALEWQGPGRYRGRLTGLAEAPGTLRVELAPTEGLSETVRREAGTAVVQVMPPAALPAGEEAVRRLRQISERTGGTFGIDPATFSPSCEDAPERDLPLWRLLAVTALLVHLAELGVRRLRRV